MAMPTVPHMVGRGYRFTNVAPDESASRHSGIKPRHRAHFRPSKSVRTIPSSTPCPRDARLSPKTFCSLECGPRNPVRQSFSRLTNKSIRGSRGLRVKNAHPSGKKNGALIVDAYGSRTVLNGNSG